jgi:hypothetical protein
MASTLDIQRRPLATGVELTLTEGVFPFQDD